MRSFSESYRDAGVNIEAGYEGVKLMKKHVQRTMIPGVVSDIGGFGGLFAPDLTGMSEPVLVSGTDGVGTKQRIAQLMNKHDSVGIDCVAMCVNDIICCGAKPIFFLDYIAIGKNEPEKVATLVSGVAEGCVQSGCALIGGETAEHPGTMSADDYDLAGFAVGIVDRAKIIDHDRMRPGDVVIALTSSGIHSNGYSLVRKVFNVEHADLGAYVDELGCTLGEELLRPTKIYVKPVLAAMDVADVHGVSHITGGGFYENIPRCIPDGLCAKIDKSALRTPPIFSMLQRMGSIPEHDMFNTYNMGVGMTMIVAKDDADKALAALKENGQDAYVIGEVVSGEEKGTMLKSARIAVFVSGGGTNLQALLDAQRDGKIPHGEIALVISSQACAYALERAEKANVPAHTVPSSLIQHDFEAAIELLLEQYKIDVIVLAGFLSILSENFTKKWPRRILNIHPSLIPSFCGRGMYGLKVHEAALARGVKVTGATVHFVNEIPDGGEIILQKAVEIEAGDTPETLQRRVMEQAEWKLLPRATELVCRAITEEEN